MAIDDLMRHDVPLRTRQVETGSGGWEHWDPGTYRPSNSNSSLHTPDRKVWHGHEDYSFGLLLLYAAEQGIISRPWDTLKRDDWWEATDKAREGGAPIPEYVSQSNAESGRELLGLYVVIDPEDAVAAARAVEQADLSATLPELDREGADDVAVAVALHDGMIDSPGETPNAGAYTDAYYTARNHYRAPLPEYIDNTVLAHRQQQCFDALARVRPKHIVGNTRSTVTVKDPTGIGIAKLDPT